MYSNTRSVVAGYWVARANMYAGAGTPPVKCSECKADPRAGNCAGRTYVPACCNTTPSCDGRELPTDDRERGKDYLHSSYIDLVISGMVGLRAAMDEYFTVVPLASGVSFFALDNIALHGHNVSIGYDATGARRFPAQCHPASHIRVFWI